MTLDEFLERNGDDLRRYAALSCVAGDRPDYVQGGGGNTSVKLRDGLMAIKASGFRLSQVTDRDGYAVLDAAAIRAFYRTTDPAGLDDVEAAGSACAKANAVAVDGLPALRPSVEAGFHSLLDRFVLHTHPVYGNLPACAAGGRDLVDRIFADAPYSVAFVPYINPGASLTFAIRDEMERVLLADGRSPSVLLMQNHGLIATADDGDACERIHWDANHRCARFFGVRREDFPQPVLERDGDGFRSATPWLAERLRAKPRPLSFYVEEALYPDQLVFLAGSLAVLDGAPPRSVGEAGLPARANLFRETGDILYRCGEREAMTIEETLCAIHFIVGTLEAGGYQVSTLSEAGRSFIAGWESEKYRKSLNRQGA